MKHIFLVNLKRSLIFEIFLDVPMAKQVLNSKFTICPFEIIFLERIPWTLAGFVFFPDWN